MSIATELTNLNNNILDAYSAVQNMGGTVPGNKNMANLDTAINSIPAPNPYAIDRGTTPLIGGGRRLDVPINLANIVINHNIVEIGADSLEDAYPGNYTANVDMSTVEKIGSAGMAEFTCDKAHASGGGGVAVPSTSTLDASALEEVQSNGLEYAFANHNFGSISFPSLTTVWQNSFNYAFFNARYSGGVSATFGALTTVSSSNAFNSCFSLGTGNSMITDRGLNSLSFPVLTTLSSSATSFFNYACSCNGRLTTIDFGELQTIYAGSAFNQAFRFCGIVTMNGFPKLEEVNSSSAFNTAFSMCTNMTSVSFPKLKTIGSGGSQAFSFAFAGDTALTTVDFSLLETISSSSGFSAAFQGCTALASISFPSLTTISNSQIFSQAFRNCTALTSISFPSLTEAGFGSYVNQFNNMLQGVTGCTVHFPSAVQAKVETTSGYPNYGGTSTTVLFDL